LCLQKEDKTIELMCFNNVESWGERKDDITTQSILLAIPNKEDKMNYKFK
jgi:hypothetical protein